MHIGFWLYGLWILVVWTLDFDCWTLDLGWLDV